MNKQRKFVLIAAAVGVISMFFPWVSFFGLSINGLHDKGIVVFLCFVASGIIAYLGDQTKNLDKTMWAVTLLAGAVGLLMIIWFYFQASDSYVGSSFLGFGFYISGLASLGILIAAYVFRSPTDNIKDSFNTLKKDIESKINTPANTTTPDDKTNNPGGTNPPS